MADTESESARKEMSQSRHGMIQSVRYAGLVAVAGLFAGAGANFEVERLEVGDDDVVFFPGDLSVAGDVENGGIVVAAGDLRIGGQLPGRGAGLLAAGGRRHAHAAPCHDGGRDLGW